jgi:hypothetical protein
MTPKHTASMLRRQLARASAFAAMLAIASPALAANDVPFQISVDGQRVDGTTVASMSVAKDATGLDAVDIQVKFDGLGVRPMLNVSSIPPKTTFKSGETVRFLASFNYAAWIDRAEILIFERGQRADNGVLDTLEVSALGTAEWQMPVDGPAALEYVLRVYDADGRYDETVALPLIRSNRISSDDEQAQVSTAPGYGEDRAAVRNIDVHGGAITVYGKHVPGDHAVTIMGEAVPLDADGSFVTQRVLPPGEHGVEISVLKDGAGLEFTRDVVIPQNEWFAVGLADFTVGHRFNSEIEAVRPGEFNDTYSKGRLAFYLKGKIKGRYILTAAADTGEQQLKHIFRGLDEKDPRSFLKRIDPDDYYPVYGDDSTAFEDAPTRGKFYVRLDKGPSHIMWGNFKSNITGTTFLRNERALYGASGVYRSRRVVPNGEAGTALDVYAAQPGTVPQRDVLRGTGGSAYFLKHQDITQGSETVSIEIRNAVTGFVSDRRTLKYNDDYEFDYVQGVIILRRPLSSSSGAGTENFLVASYEFTPVARDVDGYAVGGRAQQWLGDRVRVGVSAMREKTEGANQTVYGADIRVEKSPGTYIEAEVARSEGPGFGKSYSPDGGLTTINQPTAGVNNRKANAYRVVARATFQDLTDGAVEGKVQAQFEHYEKGFSSLDVEANEKKTNWGVETDAKLSERIKVSATYSEAHSGSTQVDREGQGKVRIGLGDHVSIEPYARHQDRVRPASTRVDAGRRTDAGARLIYTWDEKNEAYIFGQATLAHAGALDKDHRVGVGGRKQITDRIGLSGEISTGSLGFAAQALFEYEPSDSGRYYLGYRLEAEREDSSSWPFALLGNDMGTVVVGANQKLNDDWELFGEDNYDMFGRRKSLTQTYGVKYTPNESWTFGGGVEIGTVYDNTKDSATGLKNPDFDRKAVSLSAAYHTDEGLDAKIKGEARFEDSDDDTRDLESYLFAADVGVKVSEDWRALGSLDAVFTDATDAIKEGNYAEGSVGFAYRPAEGDKFNALVKYTYLYDNPGKDQVTVDGTEDGPSQQSHIFSADMSYDILPQLTLGAKYGFRISETKDRIAGAEWENADAHLGILRADFHLVHEWDAMLEGRVLWSPSANQAEYALLVALYRQIGENFKVGIGYNFGQFSDDLRDHTFNDGGIFVNIVGKI